MRRVHEQASAACQSGCSTHPFLHVDPGVYFTFSPRAVTRSKNSEISRLRKSTSAGKTPPAEACPVMVPGLMVVTLTSRMNRAALTGSHSGLSRSLVPTRMRVFALIARSAPVLSPLNPRRRADVVFLVSPRLVNPIVRIERLDESGFLRLQVCKDVERVIELIA
jgi:hypothetical protein